MSAGRWNDGTVDAAYDGVVFPPSPTLEQIKASQPRRNGVIDGLRVNVSDLSPGKPVETEDYAPGGGQGPDYLKAPDPVHTFSAVFTPKGMRVIVDCRLVGKVTVALPLADGAEIDCPCGWLLRTRVHEDVALTVSEFDPVERQILARAREVKKPSPAPHVFGASRGYAEVLR